MSRFVQLFSVLLFMLATSLCQASSLRVAAAADLRYVMPDLIAAFKAESGVDVAVTYAASGNLTSQIRHGAPYDVFFSANPSYIRLLVEEGLTAGNAIDYAQGYLALFANRHSSVKVDRELTGLEAALASGNISKIAIANPQHAPYGQAAVRVLNQAGLYDKAKPFLLLAENASQVTQFSLTADVDIGFIPYTHALQPAIARRGQSVRLDIKLQQQMVVLKSHQQGSAEFAHFIQTEPAKRLFQQHGFDVTGQ